MRLPLLTKLALLALLTPVYFSVGSLSLTPSKTLFLIVVPVLTVNLLRGLYGRLLATDAMVFGYVLWMAIAMLINHSPRVAIEYTGSNSVILLGGYLTARATIRDKETFVGFIRFLALIVVLSLPFALYEVITSKTTIPRWVAQIPGVQSYPDINHEPRFGLWRAQVVFQHPIHYGFFCSFVFSLVFVGLAERLRWFSRIFLTGIIGLCSFFSVSSGPVLAVLVQVGLTGWSAVMKRVAYRWSIFWSLTIFAYIILELASTRSAIYAIVSRISFSSSTAFYRRILFEYGVRQVERAPVFGVGENPWPIPRWMTGSVDNFWLLVAIRFGLPALVLLVGAFVVVMIQAGLRNFEADRELVALRRAWVFTLVSIMLVLCTVAIWGEIYSMVLLVLGSGMWFLTVDVSRQVSNDKLSTDDPPSRVSRYSRFSAKTVHRAE